MDIAQHSVAREGQTHPHQQSNAALTGPNDSAALAAFRCDSVNLPWIIFRAAFRANHIEQLPQRARAVLSALARTVDAGRPYGAIFARREILTGRAMQSMRTFYRSLDDLEAADLIDRRPQSRYVEIGRFGRSNLHLTERAAILLGLVEPEPEPSTVEPDVTQPAHLASNADAPSFASPIAKLADGGIYKDLSPSSFQKRQPGQVPSDLQRLRSLGFLDFLIFKLMREARDNGKRLSDVVEVTWEHLKAAKRPINYLRALLQNPVDFGLQLRRRADATAESKERLDRAAYAERVANECAGKTFVDAHGTLKYVVDADALAMSVYRIDERVARQAAGWKEQFAEGLRRGRIRAATQEDLETFAQSRRLHEMPVPRANAEPVRTEVTKEVRGNVAALWSLLRAKGFATRGA
ncbi:Replication protein O [Paraburkholderia sp. DHOC27]|uniref:Replication protein O n=1 Tax=Paraburkholderia sp. DHOC27 TaxID=2303330 RepID=UPI000E3E7108|nr:Replication protein O [Paraburkholderia sp. DHOC27]RFU44464.1 Replication protein O [Paraburkholderia sp. DHOC27]